jgi:NADH-quinone oxidoreductase subunit L
MRELLWLIPALPFAGFLALVVLGSRLSKRVVAMVGVGSVAISAAVAILISASFMSSPPQGHSYTQTLWRWMEVGGFIPAISLYLDPLSVVMVMVVTFVGFLIHLYSVEFMADEEGYGRFFAYMNLFVGSMLTLILAGDLLLLYLGWEGVGLCSYLLIGFWYKDPANGRAAMKAFIVTRIGDAAMAVGLFLLFYGLGTLGIQELMQRASHQWPVGSSIAVAAAALLLTGAVGKSAQLPLQTWLPDAMAGPTPVSALIHAATMVTAGVYLIARTHVLFTLAPAVQLLVAIIGAVTLLVAGFSALTQRDIKRVLAYSTMSQIGYMFLALGIGAWSAAIFHFMTHAFFKALLFLSAGAVILALDHEHDMFRMGGLRKQLPLTFWTFLMASLSLSALPFVDAGFYSKELVLWQGWSSDRGSTWLWAAGVTGAFVTSLYTFRMVFVVFYGGPKTSVVKRPRNFMLFPMVILAFFSLFSGFVEMPGTLGNVHLFTDFLKTTFRDEAAVVADTGMELFMEVVASVVSLAGLFVAHFFFIRKRDAVRKVLQLPFADRLHHLLFSGWGFDWLYHNALVKPFVGMARSNRDDVMDLIYSGIAWYQKLFYGVLSLTQSGKVRWYAMGITLGAIMVIGMVVFL